jgi:hypothetical protein
MEPIVATRGAAHEHPVAVEQAHRQPVHLGLDDVLEAGGHYPFACEMGLHTRHPRAQLLLAADVAQREHRLEVLHLLQSPHRLPADALGGRVGGEQLRELSLQRAQLVEQRVVGVV